MNEDYSVYSEFDLEKHKKTYINYLEVIIHPDGKVAYAVPSHQKYLEHFCAESRNMTMKEFIDSVPREYWVDYLYYLAVLSHCVIVWSQGYFGIDITEEQRSVLDEFVEAGLMRDTILKV